MLRGDLTRMLIIARAAWSSSGKTSWPASSAWPRRCVAGDDQRIVDGNPFTRYPILIARMDQLARNDDLLACSTPATGSGHRG